MEQRLPGGRNDGAVRAGDTVRRATGTHTPAVHALLTHLHQTGFHRVPRVLGTDEQGREMLSYLPGQTIGEARPWPSWAHSDAAMLAAGRWLADLHAAAASFTPPADARWFGDHDEVRPGEVIGHHDAAPYNAVWSVHTGAATETGEDPHRGGGGELVGFIDWDLAGPAAPVRDLAFMALTWVPLTARDVAAADGFPLPGGTDVASERSRRLRLLLDAYGWEGTLPEVLSAVRQRAAEHADGLRQAAADGYGPAVVLVAEGVADDYERAVVELDQDWDVLSQSGQPS